ncbi:MAG: glycerol-3-phosphate 1-O-acyltransferase PlsY [Gemmatimonadota bacterium]|nr:MAG: glycerol-3-phosphate 1-O-acyltransferase PlsY [Gemmatimonadota bacterium]
MLTLLVVLVLGYSIGSIPTSIIIGRIAQGIDVRGYGSGNAGATNVYRVLGLKWALLVFAIDAGKAAITVLYVSQLRIDPTPVNHALLQILAGLATIAGNVWPIFAGFSGGKGVSTSTGVFAALLPLATGCAVVVWLAITFLTRYVSLGSISASVTFLVVVVGQRAVFHQQVPVEMVLFAACMPVIIILTHRSNIKRLLSGKEKRVGTK